MNSSISCISEIPVWGQVVALESDEPPSSSLLRSASNSLPVLAQQGLDGQRSGLHHPSQGHHVPLLNPLNWRHLLIYGCLWCGKYSCLGEWSSKVNFFLLKSLGTSKALLASLNFPTPCNLPLIKHSPLPLSFGRCELIPT